ARCDRAAGLCWLREAVRTGDGVWRVNETSPCLAYAISPGAADGLGAYPMALRRVTTDAEGTVISLQDVAD
ncbi:MAG: hypothetical protein K6G54_01535, partial [Oscillospiraceae bacterium]|nr:hypothetical protein [Oscillospiraceae bacterium]